MTEWIDHFDGPAGSAPDPNIWVPKVEVRSDELQCYTARQRNVCLDGSSNLKITALYEPGCTACGSGKTRDWSSARLDTRGKKQWQYGKIEARIKLPKAVGSWGAFWGVGYPGSWPAAGEIDILEYPQQDAKKQLKMHQGLHSDAVSDGSHCSWGGHDQSATTPWYQDWHLYAINWVENKIEWLIDGKVVWTVTPQYKTTCKWEFNRPFGLLLNVAVGGWGGTPNKAEYPAAMLVDYVKVTQ